MDQLRQQSDDNTVIPVTLDNDAICNNSIGPLSGITKQSWVTSRPLFGYKTKRASDNHTGDNAIIETNYSVEINEVTASYQAANSPARAVFTVPPPPWPTTLPPPSASLPQRPPPSTAPLSPPPFLSVDPAASHVPGNAKVSSSTPKALASNKAPLTRPRSISDVQAQLLSLVNSSRRQTKLAAPSQDAISNGNLSPYPALPSSIDPVTLARHTNRESTAYTSTNTKAPTSTPNEVASNEIPPTQLKSVSEGQAIIKSALDAYQNKLVAGSPPLTGILHTIEEVKPKLINTPERHPKGNAVTGMPQQPQQPPKAPKAPKAQKAQKTKMTKEEVVQEKESRKFGNILLEENDKALPNPYFKYSIKPDGAKTNDACWYANQCALPHQNPVLGRRLVLFPDGSYCPFTHAASTAVAYRIFYDLDKAMEPRWIKQTHGIRRLTDGQKIETLALRAALEIVQKEAKAFFATFRQGLDGKPEPLRIYIFADSLEAIRHLEQVVTRTVNPKNQGLDHILQLTNIWKDLQTDVRSGNLKLQVRWVPGHKHVDGNVIADRLASKTLKDLRQSHDRLNQLAIASLNKEIARLKEILAKKSPPHQGTDEAQKTEQESLAHIQKLFANFLKETRDNSEKQTKLAFEELRKELSTRALEQDTLNTQVENVMMALEEATSECRKILASQSAEVKALRKELAAKSAQQEVHDNARAESMAKAVEEVRECRQAFAAAQSLDVEPFQKAGEEMLRALREELEVALKTVAEAGVSRGVAGQSGAGGETEVVDGLVEEAAEDQVEQTSPNSDELPVAPMESQAGGVEDAVADERQAEATTSCASSGETVFGESKAQTAGSDVREDTGDNSTKKDKMKRKLLLRVLVPASLRKSARKLRIPFAGASSKAKVNTDSRA